jgi:Transposase DDE domain
MLLPSDQEPAPKSVSSHEATRRPPSSSLKRRSGARAEATRRAVDPHSCPTSTGVPEAPLAVSASLDPRAVLDNLPLADAVLSLCSWVLSPAALDRIFQAHRGRSFEKLLSFPVFARLIADALLQHQGSGRQSFQRADEQGTLPTSAEAAYGKLRRVPVSLSLGFLEDISAHLRELFPPGASAWVAPRCLEALNPVILDGKTLKKVAKRLKATRGALGKISGGKLLVAVDPRSGLALTMAADLDGEANEARLVPDVLPGVGRQVPGHRLWIADRQFGDPVQIGRFLAREGDHVLVRWDGRTSFHPDPERPAVTGADARGRAVIQEWGRYGVESNKQRRYLRRITLLRPGEEAIVLMTDLLCDDAYPAAELLEAYLARWRIERVFQEITEVFSLKRLIGSTARATIFQGAFCLVLYNLIQVVRAYIAEGRPDIERTDDLSSEQIFYDVRRQLTAVYELVKVPELVAMVGRPWAAGELRVWMKGHLAGVWSERWIKAVNKKPRATRSETGPCFGAHNSVHRLVTGHQGGREPP